MAEAKWIGLDTVASGDWLGKRGRAGWIFWDNAGARIESLPAWMASPSISGGSVFVHSNLALTTSPWLPNGSERTRANYVGGANLVITLRPTGSAPYLVTTYHYEPANDGRVLVVTARTTAGSYMTAGTVGQPFMYTTGGWLPFLCRGDVDLVVSRTAGTNNRLIAVLFDPWPLGFAGFSPGFVGHGVF